MEQEKLNLLYQQIRIRRSDFEKRINQLIISKNLDLSLYEVEQLLNIKITSPNPLPKGTPKYIPFYDEVEKVYFILEVYKYILPEYNEIWLLYGKGDILNKTACNIYSDDNDFVARFGVLKDFITKNIVLSEYKIPCGNNPTYAMLYFQNFRLKDFLSENIITKFANVFAGINKLKSKIKLKDLNTAWLLSGEGNMFEN